MTDRPLSADPLTLRLKIMAAGIAAVSDEADGHPEARDLREAADVIEEAEKFIAGFAASAESGLARQKKALEWLRRIQR